MEFFFPPQIIKQKIEEERSLRRDLHRLRTPESKRLLNTATQAENLLHHLGHLKELGQEAMPKTHTLWMNT
jgi:hypothetical protein